MSTDPNIELAIATAEGFVAIAPSPWCEAFRAIAQDLRRVNGWMCVNGHVWRDAKSDGCPACGAGAAPECAPPTHLAHREQDAPAAGVVEALRGLADRLATNRNWTGSVVDELRDLADSITRASLAVGAVPWLPYLVDRADGVAGRYAIGRWNPAGYQEVWNLRSHCWGSASDDALTREQADELLRHMTFPSGGHDGR